MSEIPFRDLNTLNLNTMSKTLVIHSLILSALLGEDKFREVSSLIESELTTYGSNIDVTLVVSKVKDKLKVVK